MNLRNFLPVEHIIYPLKGKNRRELFEELMQPMISDSTVLNTEQFIEDLERREKEFTTQMNNSTAIPHARSNAVKQLTLTIGIREDDGVSLGDDEENLSRIFFLIGIPAFAPTAHMHLLQHIAKYAKAPTRIEKLLNCDNIDDIKRCLYAYRS